MCSPHAQIATILGVSAKGKVCKAMKDLVEEGAETIGEEGNPVIKYLALIAAAQRVEHYEISGYGTARAIAETLRNPIGHLSRPATVDTPQRMTKCSDLRIPRIRFAVSIRILEGMQPRRMQRPPRTGDRSTKAVETPAPAPPHGGCVTGTSAANDDELKLSKFLHDKFSDNTMRGLGRVTNGIRAPPF